MSKTRLLSVIAALLLLPAAASADDLSATLSGAGGAQGLASIVTGNGQVTYTVFVDGIGTPTAVDILQGATVFLALNATFENGTAFGTVNTALGLANLEANPQDYSVRVQGSGGTAQGTLQSAGDSGGGGGGGGGGDDCPAGYIEDDSSAVLEGFCFKVTITAGGGPIATRQESDCIEETVCISGALPGRSEVFLRVIGPRPNGFLWPTLLRFTPSDVTVEILQKATGITKTYNLPAIPPGIDVIDGLQDREGFEPED
jgi:hypothetical protein